MMDTFNYEEIDFSKMKFEGSIKEFFSKEEFDTMCDMERLRFKNLRLNYEMMLHFGLSAIKPDFMKPRWGKPRQTSDNCCHTDSDEEWRPRPKRKRGSKQWRPPFHTPSATVTSTAKSIPQFKRKTRQKTEKPKEEPRVYSFRKRKEVNYMKLEVPNDDEFIYCEECDQEYQGDCPEHGPFHVVEDTPVLTKKRGDPQRAMKTLPPGLEVRESEIPDAGLGVFATQFFPMRSRFGPYQGRRVTDPDVAHSSGYCWQKSHDADPDVAHSSGYCWQITTDEGYSYFVDAKDCKTANWMRYVNCARSRAEQNVTAYQHCGEVYYRAHCDIQPGKEILVWYGREYGKELGIIREEYDNKNKKRPSLTQSEPASDELTDDQVNFSDIGTSDIEFPDSSEDESHDTKKKKQKTAKKPEQPVSSITVGTPRRQPSADHSSLLHQSDHTSGALLSHNKRHKCQRCFAAFVMFSSLRLHMKSFHGDKLHTVLPVSSTPDGCSGGGHHGDKTEVKNVEKGAGNPSDSNADKKIGTHGDKDINKEVDSHGDENIDKKIGNHGDKNTDKETDYHSDKTKVKNAIRTACNHDNKKMAKGVGDRGNRKTVKKQKKDRVDDNDTDKKDVEKKVRRHVCDVCSKAFTRAGHLKTHKLIHTGHKQFVCDACSKAFTQAGDLKRHKLIHTGHKQFVCDVCIKAFTQAGDLKRHKLIHTGHKQFVCDVCIKAFTQAGDLKRHKLIHTGHKQFVCDVCSKAFTTASHLKTHKRVHTGERPYKCPHCDADFNQSSHLERHIRSVHARDKPYVCDVCGAAFSVTGDLKTHKRIHTGDKPYVCDVCGAAFSQTGNLKTHKRIHTGDKPYVCDVCGAAFSETGNLKTHKRIHTGDKPYVCTDCGKCFTQSSNLKSHQLTHTGEKPHTCPHCPAAFTWSGSLKVHVQKLHQ